MLIVFNWRGVLCCAAALGVGLYLDRAGKSALFAPVVGLIMMATDSALRQVGSGVDSGPRLQRWYLPSAGGHLWMIPVWAVGLAVVLAGGVAAYTQAHRTPNPARDAYEADSKTLSAERLTGYPASEEAGKLYEYFDQTLDSELEPRAFHILTRVTEARALVLIQAPCLRRLAEGARKDLLGLIKDQAKLLFPERQLFIGVSGAVLLGIVETPATGATLDTSDAHSLWAFYAPSPSSSKPR